MPLATPVRSPVHRVGIVSSLSGKLVLNNCFIYLSVTALDISENNIVLTIIYLSLFVKVFVCGTVRAHYHLLYCNM